MTIPITATIMTITATTTSATSLTGVDIDMDLLRSFSFVEKIKRVRELEYIYSSTEG